MADRNAHDQQPSHRTDAAPQADSAASVPTGACTVVATRLNIRSAPHIAADNVLTLVPHGTTVMVTGPMNNGFVPVTVDGQSGFASAHYLQPAGGSGMAAVQRIINHDPPPGANVHPALPATPARPVATTPAQTVPAPQEHHAAPPPPTREQIAIETNGGKPITAAQWAQIAQVVGSHSPSLSVDLVRAIAAFQKQKNLQEDGIVDDITAQWLSQAPHGGGLEALVQRNTTMYMGLNPESFDLERQTLRKTSGDLQDETGVAGHDKQANVGGKWVSLETDAGIHQALSSLPGLPGNRINALSSVLQSHDAEIRDELFNMMRYMWSVECGHALMKRVVLSGHSNGQVLWGGHASEHGSIKYQDMLDMFKQFPEACGQVEHLAFSACFSLVPGAAQHYLATFPNLKDIWGYAAWSPSAGTGSTTHLSNWDAATRGHDGKRINAAREHVAKGSGSRDQNVAIWSRESGYQTNVDAAKMSFEDLVTNIEGYRGDFNAAMNVGTINENHLNDLYANLQTIVGSHIIELQDRGKDKDYWKMLFQTLYLREWQSIVDEYTRYYGAKTNTAFKESNQTPPALTGKSRVAILGIVKNLHLTGPNGEEVTEDMHGVLRDLDPDKIKYGG